MTLREMRDLYRENVLSDREIAMRSGLPLDTVKSILSGETEASDESMLRALEIAFDCGHSSSVMLREKVLPYSSEPADALTLEDYYALPDDRRVELIDGKFYDMASPSIIHQKILLQLAVQFNACAEAHGDQCEVLIAPCDVQLDRDEKTILQPDLLVVCRKDLFVEDRRICGAPDLVLEILSPSTRSKDMILKLNKYYLAGVREYWIVDPENEKVLVYVFEKAAFIPEIYPFDAKIPIYISGNTCHINFEKIHQKLF